MGAMAGITEAEILIAMRKANRPRSVVGITKFE